MKKREKILLLFMIASMFLLVCGFDSNGKKVYDNADLFTQSEAERLNTACQNLAQKIKMDIIIYTTDGMDGYSDVQYADKIYRKYGFGYDGTNGAGIIMLVDMDSRSILFHESKLDSASYHYTDRELSKMVDQVGPYLTDRDYYDAAMKFLELAEKYVGYDNGSDSEYDGYVSGDEMRGKATALTYLIRLLVAMAFAGIVVAIMASGRKAKKVTDGNVYLKKHHIDVQERSDIFTNTTVSKRKIETNKGGGGNYHGGSFSGGGSSSHSVGGRF